MSRQTLTARERAFCEDFVSNGNNILPAMKAAGYVPNEANGVRLLERPLVAAHIASLDEIYLERLDANRDNLIHNMVTLATADARDVCGDYGIPMAHYAMPDEVANAIVDIEYNDRNSVPTKITFANRVRTLGQLAKCCGMLDSYGRASAREIKVTMSERDARL